MNKKIIVIAEIVFALIFVVILAVIMSTVTSKGNSANTKLVDTLEMTDSSSASSYTDKSIVKGERVKGAIEQIKSIGGEFKISIYVETKANKGKFIEYTDSDRYKITDSNDIDFINTSAKFRCWRIENSNQVMTGLYFAQEGSDHYNETGSRPNP